MVHLTLTNAQNIYTEHYFETQNSPPLLALFSTTTPSQALRDFINIRGQNFTLGYGATFSDSALRQSYTSAYSQIAQLSQGQSNSNSNSSSSNSVHFPLHFYSASSPSSRNTNSFIAYTSNSLHATLILVIATAFGFIFGSLVTVVMRRKGRGYGHTSHVLERAHEREEREFYERWGLEHLQRNRVAGNGSKSNKKGGQHGATSLDGLMRSFRGAKNQEGLSSSGFARVPKERGMVESTPMLRRERN